MKFAGQFFTENTSSNKIDWIEKILQTPLEDNRKYCLWRILAPYLPNIRKVGQGESYDMLYNWSEQCNSKRCLDFTPKQRLKKS